MKIPKKWEAQQIVIDYLFDIDSKNFILSYTENVE